MDVESIRFTELPTRARIPKNRFLGRPFCLFEGNFRELLERKEKKKKRREEKERRAGNRRTRSTWEGRKEKRKKKRKKENKAKKLKGQLRASQGFCWYSCRTENRGIFWAGQFLVWLILLLSMYTYFYKYTNYTHIKKMASHVKSGNNGRTNVGRTDKQVGRWTKKLNDRKNEGTEEMCVRVSSYGLDLNWLKTR